MREDVPTTSGERLALDWHPPLPGRPVAIYLHGFGSHRAGEKALALERTLTGRGCGFARFDFRGHGDSEGSFAGLTLTRLLEDVERAVAAVAALVAPGAAAGAPPLLLIGSSLGGLAAAWHAMAPRELRLPLAGLVLIAPAFRMVERYVDAVGPAGRARWERKGRHRFAGRWFDFELSWDAVVDARRYPHATLLERLALPVLVLHGDADDTTPLALSEEFARGCRRTRPQLVVIQGGDHRLTAHLARLEAEIVRFVEGVVR